MKTKILILAVVIAVVAFVAPAPVSIVIKGSDTVLPISQKEAEVFMKKNAGSKVTVVGGGSGVGIAAIMDGSTDIAMSSRKMKMSEKMKMQDAGKPFKETIIAYDALAVIVHPSNKISQLTREQIESIYTGKVTNWNQVGGDDMKIVAYSRESSSGTYEFFKEHIMMSKNYGSTVLNMPATGAIVQSVSQTKGAIGYVGMAYIEDNIKALKVSMDKGKTFVAPNMANAKNKSYKVTRPLFYYYETKKEAKVKSYVDFVLSTEGQAILEKVGYVGLK